MNRVVISMLGTKLDQKGSLDRRWASWRPNLSLVSHANFPVNHFILLHQPHDEPLALLTIDDLKIVSPNTKFERYTVNYRDPWNFESVYAELHDFALAHQFDPEVDDVYVNISTGTHVVQICLFLLTESRYLPAKLLQTSPDKQNPNGKLYFIDLNLSSYDQISARFAQQQWHHTQLLKQGIDTRNQAFNQLIQLIEKISVSSKAPLLLTGETGVGKSKMASLIYQLKKQRGQVSGQFVEVNCATLRGDQAMSSLFGHRKGAFTGALMARAGFLMQANQGLLFLDEIGELGLDEQAMLLRAIEDKSFTPLGSDQAVSSDFQLIAGTNRSLSAMVLQGKFREDLLARINVWTIELPSLRQRLDDIEPNISFELQQMTRQLGYKVSMNHHAKERYLTFAMQEDSLWRGNFRDLSASIQRMATLADGGRITEEEVNEELLRLQRDWQVFLPASNQSSAFVQDNSEVQLSHYLPDEKIENLDLFDQLQLKQVIRICQSANSLSDAGRKLFQVSRTQRNSVNDSHRLRMYLQKFNLSFDGVIL